MHTFPLTWLFIYLDYFGELWRYLLERCLPSHEQLTPLTSKSSQAGTSGNPQNRKSSLTITKWRHTKLPRYNLNLKWKSTVYISYLWQKRSAFNFTSCTLTSTPLSSTIRCKRSVDYLAVILFFFLHWAPQTKLIDGNGISLDYITKTLRWINNTTGKRKKYVVLDFGVNCH